MKPSTTLAILACAGMAGPQADAAVSIQDDTVKLEFGVRLQTRLSRYDGESTTGADYNVQTGQVGKNDPFDFMVRRSRLYAKGSYGAYWKFQFALQGDEFDRQNVGSPAVQVRYAWVERILRLGDSDSAIVHFGLDKPFFNPADFVSSSALLLPTNMVNVEKGLANRSVGLGLRWLGPMYQVGADIQNVGGRQAGAVNVDESEGFWYSARIEGSFAKEWYTARRQESYVGKEGNAFILGVEYGTERDRFTTANTQRTRNGIGVDALLWIDAITAIIDWDRLTTKTDDLIAADPADVEGDILTVQIGYAFPLDDGQAIEPAVRFSRYDTNQDVDNVAENWAPAAGGFVEHGSSGREFDVGLNWYFNGHGNKLQLAYTNWSPEEGDASASIIRVQHQLNF